MTDKKLGSDSRAHLKIKTSVADPDPLLPEYEIIVLDLYCRTVEYKMITCIYRQLIPVDSSF